MGREKVDNTGEIYDTNEGYKATVIKSDGALNLTVQFNDERGTIVGNLKRCAVKNGQISNPYHKTIFGVGYYGIGDYSKKTHAVLYKKWYNMLKRCLDEECQKLHPTYKDVSICENWEDLQIFGKWYEENYVEDFELDKDILFKGNKLYSPETCCFVPKEINTLFTKRQNHRGKYPIGVKKAKGHNFEAYITIQGEKKHLGTRKTPEEAFLLYKEAKEKEIKRLANKWRGKITEACYWAMMNYQVEITD